jgi:peroxiredoxin
VPEDDGASDHLPGARLPSVPLASTAANLVDLSALDGRTVVYCYPMTGKPGKDLPQGWNEIPGARGCSPQSCFFRDHHAELRNLGARVYGISTQDTDYQTEAAERLHLPFELLSDEDLEFATALGLPPFEVEGIVLLKRLTFVANGGLIRKVFYPRSSTPSSRRIRTPRRSSSGSRKTSWERLRPHRPLKRAFAAA